MSLRPIKLKKGIRRTMASPKPTFEEWMDRVNRALLNTRGISIHDMPDYLWRKDYNSNLKPLITLNRAIRYWKGFGW